MKRFIQALGILVGVFVVAFVVFFFWASSGALSEDALATTTAYDAAPATPSDTLTVMTYNIGYLSGMTNNEPVERDPSLFSTNLEQVIDMLRRTRPDIVGFQEIDLGAARSLYVNQLDTLAKRLDYPAAATAVNWDERYLPYPGANPATQFGRVLSGQAVLSRYPIEAHERIELARTSRPFYEDALYLDRLAQIVRVNVGGRDIVVINVHLEAFEEDTREAQAREVRTLVERYLAEGIPLLLIGDFNSVADAARSALSPEMQAAFAGDETLALMLDGTGLRSVFPDSVYASPDTNIGTYPADAPTRTIDHIFYTPSSMRVLDTEVMGGGSNPPSDHRAVWARFVLTPSSP